MAHSYCVDVTWGKNMENNERWKERKQAQVKEDSCLGRTQGHVVFYLSDDSMFSRFAECVFTHVSVDAHQIPQANWDSTETQTYT